MNIIRVFYGIPDQFGGPAEADGGRPWPCHYRGHNGIGDDFLGFLQDLQVNGHTAVFGGIWNLQAAELPLILKGVFNGNAHAVFRELKFVTHGLNVHEQVTLHDYDIRFVALICGHLGLHKDLRIEQKLPNRGPDELGIALTHDWIDRNPVNRDFLVCKCLLKGGRDTLSSSI